MTTSPDYDGPVYVGAEGDEPELVDADVDEGPDDLDPPQYIRDEANAWHARTYGSGPVPAVGERAEDEQQRYAKWLRAMVDAQTFEGHTWVLSVDSAMKAGMAMADREARIEDGLAIPISWDEWEATHEALIAAQAERCPDPKRHVQQIGWGSRRWYVVPEDEYDRLTGADAEPFGRVKEKP